MFWRRLFLKRKGRYLFTGFFFNSFNSEPPARHVFSFSIMEEKKPVTALGLFNLFVVYIIWGSTYLAIRVAVREGSGFPPFMLGATRTLASGSILLVWAFLIKGRKIPTRNEWLVIICSGLLLWIGGNGLVTWAEQRADSGFAALLLGTLPLWVALVESIIDRRRPSLGLIGALMAGFSGLVILSLPTIRQGTRADILSMLALLFAPLFWGCGSILLARRPVKTAPQALAGYQQLVGCIAFFLISLFFNEPPLQPAREAVFAWVYLVIAGGVCAFTAYMYALKLLPTALVATYAYVNPVIAVFLGWLILREAITPWTILGAALILLGVFGVFRVKTAAN